MRTVIYIKVESLNQYLKLRNHYIENEWCIKNDFTEIIDFPCYIKWHPRSKFEFKCYVYKNRPVVFDPRTSLTWNNLPPRLQKWELKQYYKDLKATRVRDFFDENLIKGSKK